MLKVEMIGNGLGCSIGLVTIGTGAIGLILGC